MALIQFAADHIAALEAINVDSTSVQDNLYFIFLFNI
jgi:hypothetical protein